MGFLTLICTCEHVQSSYSYHAQSGTRSGAVLIQVRSFCHRRCCSVQPNCRVASLILLFRLVIMAGHRDCRMYESKFPDVDDVVMVRTAPPSIASNVLVYMCVSPR